jgi:hypothetical protein
MNSLAFWKTWNKSHRLIFWLLALPLICSVLYFWFAYFISPAPAITWEQFQQLSLESIPTHTFTKGIFEIPVYSDNLLVYEILAGSDLQPSLYIHYLLLFATAVSVVVLLAIISSLGRYWFIIGMGLFCIFIVTLQLDTLAIFGLRNNIPTLVSIFLFSGVAYYFHAFRPQAALLQRLIAFAALGLIIFGVIMASAEVNSPLLHLSVNSYALAVSFTLIFILTVAHEIPAAFIQLITRGNKQEKSLQHFLVIFGFYFLNLILSYGIKIGYIPLSIWTIDFYLLFTFSAILGIWGFRHREPLYTSFFSADPAGTYFILSFALTSFVTLAYFMTNAHDTVLIVIKDVIIYSHLGYGIIFLFYVLSNFGSMLSQNLHVYRVLYKPNTMPYFTFRLMGLICTFAFLVFDTNWRTPINQVFASYYNGVGDLYFSSANTENAETSYRRSVFFRNHNHHAHYALAGLHTSKLEPRQALNEWIAASECNPPEQTIINLCDAYLQSDKNSEAIYALERAGMRLKNNGYLHNAKGLIYSQLKMPDSAFQAFQLARQHQKVKEIAETNLLASSIRFKISYPADSLFQLLGSKSEAAKANALALANLQQLPIELNIDLGTDTVLTATRTSFLCNYFLNQRKSMDTLLLNYGMNLARRPANEAFKEYLLASAAQAYYAIGRVKQAFDILREVAYSTGKGKYFSLLASWALEQNNAPVAADYFAIAREKQQPFALFHEALARTEAGDPLALPLWDSLARSKDVLPVEKISKLKRVLTATQVENLQDDESKYLFCRYRLSRTDTSLFKKIYNSIRDEEIKIKSILEFATRWYQADEPAVAARYLHQAENLRPKKETTLAQFYYLHSLLLAYSKNWDELENVVENELLNAYYSNSVIYFRALLDEKNGNRQEADKKFNYLATANVYFDDALIASARFFEGGDPLKPYSILVNGLLVNPNSVKLLKAYIKQSALMGFNQEAEESLQKLKQLISPASFNQYLKENLDFFQLE